MKINTILLKKIESNLSGEEELKFQKWLEKSEKNKELYNLLLLLKAEKKHIKIISDLDVNVAWKSIQEKSYPTKQTSVNYLNKRVLKFAVAASVLLLITATFIYKITSKGGSAIQNTPIIVNNTIKKGTDKAILTLEDGTEVVLNNKESFNTSKLSSNGKQIVYKSGHKVHKDIQYNYLTIPRGGQYFVKLSDGTQVWLNSESKLKYPVSFVEGETREVELVYGEAYFDVSPSETNKGASFLVNHDQQEIQVLGTEFNIKAYKADKNIYTTLVEGKVAISTGISQESLLPNQQSIYNTLNHSLVISEINVKPEISWKDGVFIFESKELKGIMLVLSRWYDMDVVFDTEKLENQKFTGLINKNYGIQDIMSVMKDTDVINTYSINGKTITLK
ncbi:hypothetical protein APS56_15715 [Pseudalgibacter alginicilyticus]|uniref:Anti-sigma factor n=1 Tax=Pseudalgibacter alginicilyticus TaxID=1736674 RepID=A0A0P0DC14_9FLAO|nr:FecR family protein [Pseudalgibacter alginicilyticus]ALJ06492.1 hypothetical protein APS56_15715 [Pseudalgibacter alginicilyticus]